MKRILSLAIACLSSQIIFADPIAPVYFSEIQFTASGWIIEFFPAMDVFDSDSAYLTTKQDTAYLKPGCIRAYDYSLITPDSLFSELRINPENDTIRLYLNISQFQIEHNYADDQLILGNLPFDSSQSLSRKVEYGITGTDFWYLDNSPTLGYENDTENAMGTINFQILDEDGFPIPVAGLYRGIRFDGSTWGDTIFIYTDSVGVLVHYAYACNHRFLFMKDGYTDVDTTFLVRPDSIYSIILTMESLEQDIDFIDRPTASRFYLSPAYPNPFNNSTTFSYRLPEEGFVILSVYSIAGGQVAELFRGYRYAGDYQVKWNADGLSSGIYIIHLISNRNSVQRKSILLK